MQGHKWLITTRGCLTPAISEAPGEDSSSIQLLVWRHWLCNPDPKEFVHSDRVSPELWGRTGHFVFLLQGLKIKEVTFVLQWTSALTGDIGGCDSWGMPLTSSGWRSRVPLNVLTLQGGKVPPAWYKKWMQSKYLHCQGGDVARDWRPLEQVCSQGSLDGSRITSQMVCTGLQMHSLPSVCCPPAGLQWKNTFLC